MLRNVVDVRLRPIFVDDLSGLAPAELIHVPQSIAENDESAWRTKNKVQHETGKVLPLLFVAELEQAKGNEEVVYDRDEKDGGEIEDDQRCMSDDDVEECAVCCEHEGCQEPGEGVDERQSPFEPKHVRSRYKKPVVTGCSKTPSPALRQVD